MAPFFIKVLARILMVGKRTGIVCTLLLVAVSGLLNLLAAGLQTGIKNHIYFRVLSIDEQHVRLLDIGMF
jgi:hypothetical protein